MDRIMGRIVLAVLAGMVFGVCSFAQEAEDVEGPDPEDSGSWLGWMREVEPALKEIGRSEADFAIKDHEYWEKRREEWLKMGLIDKFLELPKEKDDTRLPLIDQVMENPFMLPKSGFSLHTGMGRGHGLLNILVSAARCRGMKVPEVEKWESGLKRDENPFIWLWRIRKAELPRYIETDLRMNWGRLPREAREACSILVPAIYHAQELKKAAMADLSPQEVEFLLNYDVTGAKNGIAYDAAHDLFSFRAVDTRTLIGFLKTGAKVKQDELYKMAWHVLDATDKASDALRGLGDKRQQSFRMTFETPLGAAFIGGGGGDYYSRDAFLIIDLGGDDIYANNAGSARAAGSAACVCIDVFGNDTYSSNAEFVQGAAYLGVGVLMDMAGHDKYLAGSYSQGCGVFGTGILFDSEGNDGRAAEEMCQGAALFGYGLSFDGGGNDNYVGSVFAQGVGRMMGVGLCADMDGDDTYMAGGRYRDTSRHANTYISMSQGCGQGYYLRDITGSTTTKISGLFPGGVGILYDRSGNDRYQGEVFCQGVGYFYALGMLVDVEGDDQYKGYWYGQGAAAHFAVGACMDISGDDSYTTPHQALGNGRDFSHGFFYDGAGDDRYVAEERSIGSGDLRGGFGIFVDRAGNDRYVGKKACLGYGTPDTDPEDGISLGLFLDLAGKDSYSVFPVKDGGIGADKKIWVQKGCGIGADR